MHPQQYAEVRQASQDPDSYIDVSQAAKLLGLSDSYLNALRVRGGGPIYSALSRKAIRYRVADLLAWAASKARASTSQQAA